MNGLYIERKEVYRGLTSPQVTWVLLRGAGELVQEFTTRKAAIEALDWRTMPQEAVWAKYPHLRP